MNKLFGLLLWNFKKDVIIGWSNIIPREEIAIQTQKVLLFLWLISVV